MQENNMQPLWEHQKRAVKMALTPGMDCLGLFMEVGVGKSRTMIEILRYLCAKEGRILKTLILAPKIVLTNWKREFAKYSKIHSRDIVILSGPQGRRKKDFMEAVLKDHALIGNKIIITNYEALQMEELFTLFMDWCPEVMVADEAHRLKNPEGKRAKAAIRLSDITQYRYALTGTPILNSAMDVFNVFRFLDKGETFGKNFWKFRSIWFEDENARWAGNSSYFPSYVPRPDTYQEFHQLIYKKAVRARKSECLDLPPFVRKEVFVELGREQLRLYREMRDEYIAYVKGLEKSSEPRAVVAQLAVTKALRLQQIVTGFAKTEDGSVHKIKDNPRIKALEDLLEQLTPEHKVIVWSVFHENYADIAKVCEKLKIPYTELHGKIPQGQRDDNIATFTKDPKCRVLIANQAAGGIGINLVESDVSIFYSKNFSLEQDLQAEGRNYRGGSEQHKSVTRIDIVAEETIDQLIAEALATKQNIGAQILDWRDKL
jgi:SNF2 family DNA or RNA helicase